VKLLSCFDLLFLYANIPTILWEGRIDLDWGTCSFCATFHHPNAIGEALQVLIIIVE
jgi:hypothetical protein